MSKGLSALVRGFGLPAAVTAFLEDIQRNVRELNGIGVTDKDRLLVSQGDLIKFGLGRREDDGSLAPGSPGDVFDSTPPLPPTALQALGGYSQVFLKWAAPVDSIRGYFEILSNSVDNVATATKIGQTTSWSFADSLQSSTGKFYWVRSVSRFSDSIVSAFNQTAGTLGQTSPNLDYVLSVMTGADPDQPFYYLASPTNIGGVLVPAGVYMKGLYALSATVSLFRAGLAVIDDANIISLNAVKITAGEMSADRISTTTLVAKQATFTAAQFGTIFAGKAFLTSAMINQSLQSDNFNGDPFVGDSGTTGWYIGRDGTLYANGGVFRGTVKSGTFEGGTFDGGVFDGNVIQAKTSMSTYFTPPGSRFSSIVGRRAFWDTRSTGTDLAFHINGKFRVYADGLVEVDEPVISKSNVLASGTHGTAGTRLVFWDLTGGTTPPGSGTGEFGA